MLTLESYRQNLDEFSTFEFQYERKGKFTEPKYTNYLRSRSILSKWSTLSEVTSDGQAGSTVAVSKSGTPCGEKSGAFRGTTSYMDFPFTYYNESFCEILNLGTRDPKLNFSSQTASPSKKLTSLQIALISVAAVIVGIVLIAVLCTIGKRYKTREIKDKKDNDSLEDVDDFSDNGVTNSNISTNHAYNYMTNKSSNTSGSTTISSNDTNTSSTQKKESSSTGSSYFKSNLTLPERKEPSPNTFVL
ncbi:hypothetical protein TVAG_263260 [Trichomonas vaginalis G3]|uniref:Uncharacterized protein n=1 Tax=Trichomonas vaginalis (strain ATCC PRA-98 / G3) TaxID=412133 RepID=A2FA73_TRIV3|nr:hypothetical protein TVAGG3_0390890 [Trichomonas vaginalis G3]EAX98209.1 hypothetical protein TVAG_263260 [Trichomonas vaginalis G3]KAI5533985.1 hypothetical protein TVAGG3_0390890 [Trichomonas vaginalis G3]|eukprot:XP_001311139.1 hypothetical protein [Trichomonas vaginalis G3]